MFDLWVGGAARFASRARLYLPGLLPCLVLTRFDGLTSAPAARFGLGADFESIFDGGGCSPPGCCFPIFTRCTGEDARAYISRQLRQFLFQLQDRLEEISHFLHSSKHLRPFENQ